LDEAPGLQSFESPPFLYRRKWEPNEALPKSRTTRHDPLAVDRVSVASFGERNVASTMVGNEKRRAEEPKMASPAPKGIPNGFPQQGLIRDSPQPSVVRSIDRSSKNSVSFKDGTVDTFDKENCSGPKQVAPLVDDAGARPHRSKYDRSQRGLPKEAFPLEEYAKVATVASMGCANKSPDALTMSPPALERSRERPTVASVVLSNTTEMSCSGICELSGVDSAVALARTVEVLEAKDESIEPLTVIGEDESKYAGSFNDIEAGVDEESRAGEETANEESSIGSTEETDEESTNGALKENKARTAKPRAEWATSDAGDSKLLEALANEQYPNGKTIAWKIFLPEFKKVCSNKNLTEEQVRRIPYAMVGCNPRPLHGIPLMPSIMLLHLTYSVSVRSKSCGRALALRYGYCCCHARMRDSTFPCSHNAPRFATGYHSTDMGRRSRQYSIRRGSGGEVPKFKSVSRLGGNLSRDEHSH
jgi:hypothetical protein